MKSERLLVVSVALVDPSVPLRCRVDLHLGLDTVLATPELADLKNMFPTQCLADDGIVMD